MDGRGGEVKYIFPEFFLRSLVMIRLESLSKADLYSTSIVRMGI